MTFIVFNGILTLFFFSSLAFGNFSYFLFGFFGKVGFFPFFLFYFTLFSSSSFIFFFVDSLNKLSYFFIFDIFCFRLCFQYFLLLFFSFLSNFLILIVYIKNIISTKHILIVSSFIQLHFVAALLILSNLLFILSYLSLYSIGSFGLIFLCLSSLSTISISHFSFLFSSLAPLNNLTFLFLYYLLSLALQVSLPYSHSSPFFFNFFPYLNSLNASFIVIIDTFPNLTLSLSILSYHSINSLLLSFLSFSGFLSTFSSPAQ